MKRGRPGGGSVRRSAVQGCLRFLRHELDRDPGALGELRELAGRTPACRSRCSPTTVTVAPASACGPGADAPYESNPPRSGRFSGTSTARAARVGEDRLAFRIGERSLDGGLGDLHQLVRRQGVDTDRAVRSRPHGDRGSGIDVVLDAELLEREVHCVDRLLGGVTRGRRSRARTASPATGRAPGRRRAAALEAVTRSSDIEQVLARRPWRRAAERHCTVPNTASAATSTATSPTTSELTTTLPLAALGLDRPVLAFEELLRFPVAFGDAGIEEGLFGRRTAAPRWWRPSRAPVRGDRLGGGRCRRGRPRSIRASLPRVGAGHGRRAVPRRSSSRSRVHSVSNASCEISTVGLLRDRVAIEAEQAVATERVEHGAQHQAIDVEVLELAAEHSATRVLASLVERDEAEEHLAGDLVRLVAEAGQQPFGALHQRARHPAELLVRGVVDADCRADGRTARSTCTATAATRRADRSPPGPGRPRAAGSNVMPQRLRRACDRPLQLVRRHRRDDLGPVAEQFTETSVLQRPVVEVGSQAWRRPGCDSARR